MAWPAVMVEAAAMLLVLGLQSPPAVATHARATPAPPALPTLPVHRARQADSDLEVTGTIAGLAPGSSGYVRRADLGALPLTHVSVRDDENFAEAHSRHGLSIAGIPLQDLVRALGASSGADLIDALCMDNYRAHYPRSYVAAHRPLLALTIEGLRPQDWAMRAHQPDPGPYFITHAQFSSSFRVLAHTDQPQAPTNVVRLNFATESATYGAIAPRGVLATSSAAQQGFAIAKQNCFRCHNQGVYGGTKAGRDWRTLGTWAREQPAFFQNYIRNPRSFEPHAHMPGNPQYDHATVEALTVYFRTFAEGGAAR